MKNFADNNKDIPVEVFAGTAWEVALVQSLLENAEIKAYVYYSGVGTMAPWDSGGGLPINRIMIATSDFDQAKQVVSQYYDSLKQQ